MMHDVVIIGSGPAGSTVASYLNKGLKVLVLDKRDLDNPLNSIEKCCGGLIAPDAQHMLAKMGRGLPKELLMGPQIFTVKTIDFDNSELIKYYQRHYINVNRQLFDSWLASFVGDHIEKVYNAHFKSIKKSNDVFQVTYTKEKETHKVYSKMVIGADGAHSMIRKAIQGKREELWPKSYIAIEEYYEVKEPLPYFVSIFDTSITDFYSWMIPKDDSVLLGTAIPKGMDADKRFNELKDKLNAMDYNLGKPIKRQGAFINRPMSNKQICLGNSNGVYLVGESAGFISPSSSEGISYALRSGLALARAINNGEEIMEVSNIYKRLTKDLYNNITLKQLKSPVMYNPLLRLGVMKTGVLSMKVDDCIRK